MNLPGVKFNLSHGFPSDWATSRLEEKIISSYFQIKKCDLVVNATWGFLECENPITKKMSTKFKVVEYLVTNRLAKNILFFNFVDPIYDLSTWYNVFDECKKFIKDSDITCIGQIDSNKITLDVPLLYWAIYAIDNFRKYTKEQTTPKTFDNLFLCYNRKPHWHRKLLHEQMEKHKVLQRGIFTLGSENPAEVTMINADKNTLPSEDKKMHGELGIPNDTMTLGSLDIWNSHLLTIITETQHLPKVGFPFFSEKIWKPMIGMRPFLCLGDQGSIQYLKNNGFYTFNKLFGINNDDITINDIVNAIKKFNGNSAEIYDSILDQLEHNKKRFYEFAEEQKKIIPGVN